MYHSAFSAVFADLPAPAYENPVSELLKITLARCEAAGLSQRLPHILPDIIYGRFRSLMKLAPWKRSPATMVLRQICAILTVSMIHLLIFGGIDLIGFQESGFPGFCDLDIDTVSREVWNSYTWEVYHSEPKTHPRLRMPYVKLIRTLCMPIHSSGSLFALDHVLLSEVRTPKPRREHRMLTVSD